VLKQVSRRAGLTPFVKPPCRAADRNATWVLTELNPDIDLAFGLCGLGEPELGYVT
jgi:Protein of unknown function (DUF2958)